MTLFSLEIQFSFFVTKNFSFDSQIRLSGSSVDSHGNPNPYILNNARPLISISLLTLNKMNPSDIENDAPLLPYSKDACFVEDEIDEEVEEELDDIEEEEEEEEEKKDVASDTKRMKLTRENEIPIEYARPRSPRTGIYDLHCISLDWNNREGPTLNVMKNVGEHVAKTYKALSNGRIKFNVFPLKVNVDLPCHYTNLGAAERAAKRVADEENAARIAKGEHKRAPQGNLYVIVNSRAQKNSHASNKTAHLVNALKTTAAHEVGHLIGGLGHAHRVGISKNGKSKGKNRVQRSRDGTSLMSVFASDRLTAPQYFNCGWFEETQVAKHELDRPATTYKLQPVFAKESPKGYLNAVMIPRGEKKAQLFLSLCEGGRNEKKGWFLALHTRHDGGSVRRKTFKNTTEFSGLLFETISVSENRKHWEVRISPLGS